MGVKQKTAEMMLKLQVQTQLLPTQEQKIQEASGVHDDRLKSNERFQRRTASVKTSLDKR